MQSTTSDDAQDEMPSGWSGLASPAFGAEQASKGERAAEALRERGVRRVLVTMIDNGGITRGRVVPIGLLAKACGFGVGLSKGFQVVTAVDTVTQAPSVPGPVGDMRLVPDPGALRPLRPLSEWAWAPVDLYTQDGERDPRCSRGFLRAMEERASSLGISIRASFELEWFLAKRDGRDGSEPAFTGPAVGASVPLTLANFVDDLMNALDEEVGLQALNAEYSDGQLEVSVAPAGAVAAADVSVFTRQTIHAVSARHGYASSFSPVFGGPMANGGHIHLSLWRNGRNLFTGHDGPYGLAPEAVWFMAGVLDQLPALTAVGAPSAASYLRLKPSNYAGAFRCWGLENREAALRLIPGSIGVRADAANLEIKCFDEAANPYLLLGGVIAAGLYGCEEKLALPAEVRIDPAQLSAASEPAVERLPASLDEAALALEKSDVLRQALGEPLMEVVAAVARAEAEASQLESREDIIAAHLWRY